MPKIQENGTGTSFVSLPKAAVRALKWKKGTDLKAVATKKGILLTRY